MDWMIWNTAEPMTTKTKSAWKRKENYMFNKFTYDLWMWICEDAYNQLGADGVFVICFGSFLHISPLRDIFGILLIGLPHLGCAGHLEAVCWRWLMLTV